MAPTTSKLPLTVGRLVYAGGAGAGLLIALQGRQNAQNIGEYVYQAGIAAGLALILTLGVDRVLARRVAAGEYSPAFPVSIVWLRAKISVGVFVAAIVGGAMTSSTAMTCSVALFIVSRLFYADLEAFWIAARAGDRTLAVALSANGFITGLGIVVFASHSASLMTCVSAIGNVLGIAILLGTRKVHLSPNHLAEMTLESRGVAASVALGVVYARTDLLVLAATGVDAESVAVYGLVTRCFDALALIRGAIAQQETRDLAPLGDSARMEHLQHLAHRTQKITAVVGLAILGTLGVSSSVASFRPEDRDLILLACAVCPLFFSHLPTTAMVYADRRTTLLLRGSIVTTAGSVAIKVVAVWAFAVPGAVVAIGLVELLSCAVFVQCYNRSRRRAAFKAILLPAMSAVLLTSAAAGIVSATAT